MLRDPHFVRTIVLLLEVETGDRDGDGDSGGEDAVDREGSVLGVVLNRPGTVAVGDVLAAWGPAVSAPAVLFEGGPVSPESAVAVGRLSDPRAGDPVGWRALDEATGLVDLDTPTELVGPALAGLRIYAGYAGWSWSQLLGEIAEGAWYVVPSVPEDLLVEDPAALWRQVLGRQPGDLAWLATWPADPTQN
ncbi:hypothetical protein D9V37_07910 [Nocardioides mangrovicus]|uniref:YqgE/AlgH family protein n=2 Tax=Nocardioides mangrovicus TaxID=2478913 RepID=A0A3L8P693_9ACTN|nr:hypothetical protein D9V37_07910 [Nocardioides mangrovicus]